MKRFLLSLFILCFCFLSFSFAKAGASEPQLIKKWETKPDLKVSESVLYDESRDILYVSCINGMPTEKNGKGFIAKVTLKGEIKVLKWVTSLNAPKGMGISKERLFVTDIDRVVEIDIKSGKILNQYPVIEAKFLNDITVDGSGNIYVSDSSAKNSAIYKISKGKISEWLRTNEIIQPNGLYVEGDRLLVGSFKHGTLLAINLSDKKITTIANASTGIDGVKPDGKGNYIVSDWKGKTLFITKSGKVSILLDTTDAKINSADIEFIKSKNLLLIPTFFDNRVSAYELKY